MIAAHPLRMLAATFRSPFSHPRLCRQSPRGVPEPIAVALACVGMKLHSEQSGLGFVCGIFRDRREKLIQESVCVMNAFCRYKLQALALTPRPLAMSSPPYWITTNKSALRCTLCASTRSKDCYPRIGISPS